jgi:hypothetical protein
MYSQPADVNYDTRPETSSHSSKSYTDPICLEDDKSDTAMGASTQDDSVVKNKSDNIAIEQNIKGVQLEDNETESIEIVFYETNEPTDVFNESFAESFVAATTPFFHPDTAYDDYSAGSIFELANVNMAMAKACRHLTLDPGGDTSNVIIGKVKELEESFAADADPPMDILPNREAIDCVLPSLVINLIPTAVEMSPAMHGLTFSKPLSRHNAKSMVNMMDQNTKDSTSGKGCTCIKILNHVSVTRIVIHIPFLCEGSILHYRLNPRSDPLSHNMDPRLYPSSNWQ